jgi:hypothetical protein
LSKNICIKGLHVGFLFAIFCPSATQTGKPQMKTIAQHACENLKLDCVKMANKDYVVRMFKYGDHLACNVWRYEQRWLALNMCKELFDYYRKDMGQ